MTNHVILMMDFPDDAQRDEMVALIEAYWPDLSHVPEGRDLFAQYPVAGLPDNETLSALVADANLCEVE